MKQDELSKCVFCREGVMHGGNPFFYRVKIDHMAIDLNAVRRQHGLEMMMGAVAAVARVMGPNEDMALEASTTDSFLVCQDCGIDKGIARAAEVVSELQEVN